MLTVGDPKYGCTQLHGKRDTTHEDYDGNYVPAGVQHGGLLPVDKHSVTGSCQVECEALGRCNIPYDPLASFIS